MTDNLSKVEIGLYSTSKGLEEIQLNSIMLSWDDDYLIYKDKFGRKWKLEVVKNEAIQMPFIVTPLAD